MEKKHTATIPEEKSRTREREKNYSDVECLELIRSVKKYAHIIEGKNQGNRRYKNEDRNLAWEAVCQEFNIKTSQNRTVAGLKMKWKNDKSNIRDYVQYLKTSQSRSGRAPEEIPKPKFMNLMAEVIGADCPALGPVPDIDELSLDISLSTVSMMNTSLGTVKQEPPTESDLSFEQIMVNETNEFDYTVEDTSSMDSFHESTAQNHSFHHPRAKRSRLSNQVPPLFQLNGISNHSIESSAIANSNTEIHELQIQLLKRQIEVQELMATEIKAKIERTKHLMQIDAAESELRCKEIAKRLES